mgnify:CR=1 FL=1
MKIAFKNVDKLSTQFVNSIPMHGDCINNTDLSQITSDYMGVDNPTMLSHLNLRLKAGVALDGIGDNLTKITMSGDHWRKKYDDGKWVIADIMQESQVIHSCEVFGLFAGSCRQNSGIEEESKRTLQGMVPDYSVKLDPQHSPILGEYKCINTCASYHNSSTLKKRCGGVEKRASMINGEYIRKAKAADKKYNRFDNRNGAKGPMELRLQELGFVWGIISGPRGEVSKDLHKLVETLAKLAGERRWRELGARGVQDAQGHYSLYFRRTLGITLVRAQATLKRERLGLVLGGWNEASERRRQSEANYHSMREEYQARSRRGMQ